MIWVKVPGLIPRYAPYNQEVTDAPRPEPE